MQAYFIKKQSFQIAKIIFEDKIFKNIKEFKKIKN